MTEDFNRRQVLTGIATGLGASMAGCSSERSSPPSEGDSTADEGVTTETGSKSTDSTSSSGDVVHTGEEAVEEYISTVGDSSDLPEGVNGYPPVGSSEYQWVEFEDPTEQIDQNFGGFDNDAPVFFSNERGGLDSMDSLYLALTETQEGYDTAWVGLDSDSWDQGEPAVDNSGKTEAYPVEVSEESLESFLSGNINGYDDASEDISQEYLDLIEG